MRKRNLWSAALATAVAALLPLTALAKQWDDVDTWDKLADAFADTDADVTIILTGDISFANALEAKEGQTYVINGHEYTLTNVAFNGGGKVEVTAKEVKGDGDAALKAKDKADVTVNAEVKGDSQAVQAEDESKVTVNGNVSSDQNAVAAQGDANVTVNGNVTGGSEGDTSLVAANGNSQVTVNGSVTADKTENHIGTNGVTAADDSKVTVTGDVKGGDATGEGLAAGGVGVNAKDGAEVTVNGSVTGGNADAQPDASASPDPSASATPAPEAYGAPGVMMDSTAKVEVKGDVKGGNATAKEGLATGGDGGYIVLSLKTDDPDAKKAGKLVVQGSVQGGVSDGLTGRDGAGLFYQFPETPDSPFFSVTPTWNGDFFYPTYTDFSKAFSASKTEDMTDGAFSLGLIGAHGVIVVDSLLSSGILENEDAADALYQEILAGFMVKLTVQYPQLLNMSESEITDFINKLPAAEAAKLWDLYLDALRPIIDPYAKQIGSDALKNALLPTISIWGVKGGGDQAAVTSSVGLDVANLLNADIDYMIRVLPAANGTLSVDKQTAKPGETVTVTATPNEGYQVSKVMVSGEAIRGKNGVYTFTMPDHGFVEVSGEFVAGAPKTGDNSQSALWVAAMLLAAGAAFFVVKRRVNA